MSTYRLVAILAAIGGGLLLPGAGHAADSPPSKAVRECIERNGARYATPDKAWISQYVSLEDACRARFGKQVDVTLTVTPLATGVTAGAASRTQVGSTIERTNTERATVPNKAEAGSRQPRTGKTGAAAASRSSAARVVHAALAAPQVRESVRPSGFSSGWLLAALLGLTLSAAAVRIVRRR